MAAAVATGLFSVNTAATACDKGCTMGGSYVGILPQFHKNFVGIRYNTRNYTLTATHTHMVNGVPAVHTEVTKEQYHTTELWGRFYPAKRVQAFVFVPYVINTQKKDETSLTQRGLGDVTVMANYSLLNTGDSLSNTLKHTLLVGGGVKLPTGKFNATQNGDVLTANMQPGTGSVDVLLNSTYTLRYQKLGLNTDFTYRINTKGKNDYQFGNRYNVSANLFYWQNFGGVAVLPSAGVYYENAQPDQYFDSHKMQGGGSAWFGNVGVNAYYKRVAVGGTFQKPLGHHADEHITESNSRSMVNIMYLF